MDKHLTHSINNLLPLHQSENHHQAFIGYQELLLQYPNEPLHHNWHICPNQSATKGPVS